ncbi:MAG: RNA pyrophosphohydrolase [Alphaproteobacteria bacterium]|nr:RNA pyrophosphohydrolase [Alphaproteobacteria bacterium]
MEGQYRRCAGVVVFNRDGQVLLCNRKGLKGAWQFPQGGIENSETIEQACVRELFEETSIKSVCLVCSEKESIRYEFTNEIKNNFRKKGIFNDGQDIFFSMFLFIGDDSEINLNTQEPEFDEYMWTSFEFAVENIVKFKQNAYKTIANKFEPIMKQYLKSIS